MGISGQAEEADAVETATYEALAATPERGAEFAAAVRSVLADETHWVAWKKTPAPDRLAGKPQFCASFQRPPYTEPETLRKVRSKRPGGETTSTPHSSCIRVFGTRRMSCALSAALLCFVLVRAHLL